MAAPPVHATVSPLHHTLTRRQGRQKEEHAALCGWLHYPPLFARVSAGDTVPEPVPLNDLIGVGI